MTALFVLFARPTVPRNPNRTRARPRTPFLFVASSRRFPGV